MKDTQFYVKHSLLALLTLSRLPLSISLSLKILENSPPTVFFFLLYFLVLFTDFIDGKIARTLRLESRHGAILDVACDAFFIFSTSLSLHKIGRFPLWLILFIFIKFLEFIVTSKMLAKKDLFFIFDVLGRFVSACYYILPLFIILSSHYLPEMLLPSLHTAVFSFIGFTSIIAFLYRVCLVTKK